jgi:BNR repeat-containing family member
MVSTLATDGLSGVSFSGYMNGESFQQDGITTHNGWQYAAYWDSARHAVLARRQLPLGSWQKIIFSDYTTTANDSHNVICIGISRGDGVIHLAFDMHDASLKYRKSATGLATTPSAQTWSTARFGAVQDNLNGPPLAALTYPAFINAPGGKLQLAIRVGASGSGNEALFEYDKGNWASLGTFINGVSSSVNAYLFGIDYDAAGRLHTTWTWRDTPDASTNHDLMYAFSDDQGRTWKNNSGNSVAKSGGTPLTPSTSGIRVWTIAKNRGLINQESQVLDSHGVVHVVASHLPDSAPSNANFNAARETVVIHHYFRSTNGVWTRQQTPFLERLSRADVGVDAENNLYVVSGDSKTFKLHVETASAASNWTDWTWRYTSSPVYFSDPLLDHTRILSDGKLSVISPRMGTGAIDLLDFSVSP